MMKKILLSSVILTASMAALPAHACEMHGGGFSFGNQNANWQSYNPRSSISDPALFGEDGDDAYMMTRVPAEKVRPSFSNVANRAALLAKARLAKKAEDEKAEDNTAEPVKKAALNTDR